jgi:phenylacetate-CoA ligase
MHDAATCKKLSILTTDAARHVPLYRRLWGASDIKDFERVPRLDKSVLRASRPEDRLDDRRRARRLVAELSSGSSGEPLTVYSDRAASRARRWAFLHALLACGYKPGQRCLVLTSRRTTAKWTALARWSYASIAEDTELLAQRLMKLQPRVLYGPLSTLELLAQWFTAHKQRPPALAVVVSTAEQLTRSRLAVLEQGFAAPVADFYGMAEFGLVAYRPPGCSEYLPARSSLILEFLPVPGEPSVEHLVITDLAERTSPLIRYDTGDIARRERERAGWPIVEFAGRCFDFLTLPDGQLVSPYRIDVELEQVPRLRAFEVVQRADLSVDVTLETTPTDADQLPSIVRRKLESVLGPGLLLRIATGTIRRELSGTKYRPIRSLAGRAQSLR